MPSRKKKQPKKPQNSILVGGLDQLVYAFHDQMGLEYIKYVRERQ